MSGRAAVSAAAGRFLILSAGMGSGHHALAAELARRLEAAGHATRRADVLELLPRPVGRGLRGFYRAAVCRAPFVYAGVYALFLDPGDGDTPRPAGPVPLASLAEGPLLRLVERWRPDVVVPVFHLAAQLTGRLRARGALPVPSAVVITDFALHRHWLHPGNDLHLCLTERIAREVRGAVAAPAVVSGALVGPGFRRGVADPAPTGGRPVLVSAGAWGAGRGLARTARDVVAAGRRAVVLCGRNERLRARVAAVPGAEALGWVDDMPALLAGAHALVDNAAGQTALEALAAGVPVVGYRPIPGHGRDGVRGMAEQGLTVSVSGAAGLAAALAAARRDDRPLPGRADAVGRLFTADPVPALAGLARRGAGTAPR